MPRRQHVPEQDFEQGAEPARRQQAMYRQGRRQAERLVHVHLGRRERLHDMERPALRPLLEQLHSRHDTRCGEGREIRRVHGGKGTGESGRQTLLQDNP